MYVTRIYINVEHEFIKYTHAHGLWTSLLPIWCQAISWVMTILLSVGSSRTKFSEIWIKIWFFSSKKMHLKVTCKTVAVLFKFQCVPLFSAPSQPRNLQLLSHNATAVNLEWEVPEQTNGQIRTYQLHYRAKFTNDSECDKNRKCISKCCLQNGSHSVQASMSGLNVLRWDQLIDSVYRQFSNISGTQSQNINVSRLVLPLSLPNPLQLGVKLRVKM